MHPRRAAARRARAASSTLVLAFVMLSPLYLSPLCAAAQDPSSAAMDHSQHEHMVMSEPMPGAAGLQGGRDA